MTSETPCSRPSIADMLASLLWDFAGGNYVITKGWQGGSSAFSLKDGKVAAVPGDPVLVVSDLDDTMIGDDAATLLFKRVRTHNAHSISGTVCDLAAADP